MLVFGEECWLTQGVKRLVGGREEKGCSDSDDKVQVKDIIPGDPKLQVKDAIRDILNSR